MIQGFDAPGATGNRRHVAQRLPQCVGGNADQLDDLNLLVRVGTEQMASQLTGPATAAALDHHP